jgi:hypothetical protein
LNYAFDQPPPCADDQVVVEETDQMEDVPFDHKIVLCPEIALEDGEF